MSLYLETQAINEFNKIIKEKTIDTKQYDIIECNTEQLNLLYQWKDLNKDLVTEYQPVFIEGCIDLHNGFMQYFKVINEECIILRFANTTYNEVIISILMHSSHKLLKYDYSKQCETTYIKQYGIQWIDKINQEIYSLFAIIMAYIANCNNVTEIQATPFHKKPQGYDYMNKINQHKHRYERKIHILKTPQHIITTKILKTKQHGERQRYIDAWNVRGHYRVLKNGKKVFVKPYVKKLQENAIIQTKKYIL